MGNTNENVKHALSFFEERAYQQDRSDRIGRALGTLVFIGAALALVGLLVAVIVAVV